MSIRDVLQFCYDTDTTELRMFGGFGLDCTNMVRFSYDVKNCIGKYMYCTNRLRIPRSICESSTNQVLIKGNSWQLLTIRETFSLKLCIKCHLPFLDITSKINVHRRAADVLALHLECQYQLLIVRRRLLRKK